VTVDTRQTSPLAAYAERFAAAETASGGAVHLAEQPFLSQVSLRLSPTGTAAALVGDALGVALPGPRRSATAGERTVLWLGPDEWLVLGPPESADALAALLRSDSQGDHASVVDVSAQRTSIVVAGSRARDLLAHGCPLDLHPRAFGAGACASTLLARAQVTLVARDVEPPSYVLLVRSSFAPYVAEWLLDAAVEYTAGAR
jgi:sarcosine oxidase, subunit gamma